MMETANQIVGIPVMGRGICLLCGHQSQVVNVIHRSRCVYVGNEA